jgi:hypothetical protein
MLPSTHPSAIVAAWQTGGNPYAIIATSSFWQKAMVLRRRVYLIVAALPAEAR